MLEATVGHLQLGVEPSINRLPPDILFTIFTILKDYTFDDDPYSDDNDVWDWVTVTGVCRFWRNTTLNFPSLWSDLRNFGDLRKTKVFLERSANADLTLYSKIDEDDPVDEGVFGSFQLALKELHRIRSINMTILRTDTFEKVQDLFNRPAPRLQKIYLFSEIVDALPLSCFPESITSLKNLEISFLPLNLPETKLIGISLTHLTLRFLKSLHLPTFLTVLESSGGLEELSLRNVSWTLDPSSSNSKEKRIVYLQNLSFLDILANYDLIPGYGDLLKSIRIPCKTRWSFSCRSQQRELLLNMGLYLDLIMASSGCHCEMLGIGIAGSNYTVISHNTITGQDYSEVPSAELQLSWENPVSPDTLFTHTEALIRSCHWKQTKYAHVELKSTQWLIPEERWISLLLALPSINRLDFFNFDEQMDSENINLVNFLNVLTHASRAIPKTSIICPELEDISLHANYADPTFVEVLKSGLQIRKTLGFSMKKISIYSAFKYQVDPDEFSGLVEQLTWNKKIVLPINSEYEFDSDDEDQ